MAAGALILDCLTSTDVKREYIAIGGCSCFLPKNEAIIVVVVMRESSVIFLSHYGDY